MSYPNQKSIGIYKAPCNSENLFAQINIEAMFNAMRQLKSTAFKLWLYFAANQNGYSFYLSGKHACGVCGIGKTSYHEAFNELVDKYYLRQDTRNKNHYDFFEIPQDDQPEKEIEVTIHKYGSSFSERTSSFSEQMSSFSGREI